METIAQRVAARRQELGLSQTELAKLGEIMGDRLCLDGGDFRVFAEYDSDFMPMTSDSISETVPRSIGFLRMGYRSLMEFTGFVSTWIFLPGSRTAVAVSPGPRIMTPSMTAWPPTINLLLNGIPPYMEIPIASIL